MCRESIKSGFSIDPIKKSTLVKEKQKAYNLEMTLADSIDKNTYELVKNLDHELNSLECNQPL